MMKVHIVCFLNGDDELTSLGKKLLALAILQIAIAVVFGIIKVRLWTIEEHLKRQGEIQQKVKVSLAKA